MRYSIGSRRQFSPVSSVSKETCIEERWTSTSGSTKVQNDRQCVSLKCHVVVSGIAHARLGPYPLFAHPPRPALPGILYVHVHEHASTCMHVHTLSLTWGSNYSGVVTGVSQQICSKTIWISPLLHSYMIVHFHNYIWVYRQSYACANSQPFPSTVYYCTPLEENTFVNIIYCFDSTPSWTSTS